MLNFPSQEKKWSQSNSSDLFGNISATKGVHFDKEGYLTLSNASKVIYNESLDSNFDRSSVIIYNSAYEYFTQTWDNPYELAYNPLLEVPTIVNAASFPVGSVQSDAINFGGILIVSENADVSFSTAGTWTDTNISLTSGKRHPVEVFVSKNGWVVGNGNTVRLYSDITATPTLLVTLTLPADYEVTSLAYHNQQMYIGTQHENQERAVMFIWDGSSGNANGAYEVDATIIHDVVVFRGGIVILDSSGALQQFNGSGFTFLDAFPVFYTNETLVDPANVSLYHNILKANTDVLYINFSFQEGSNVYMNQPAGVWCYDPKVGLYNKYPFSFSQVVRASVVVGSSGSIDASTDVITTVATTVPVTGTEVVYNASTVVAPLVDDTKYYVIKLTTSTFKLATTKANALAGTAIDITGTASGKHDFIYMPNVDYGTFYCDRPAALAVMTGRNTVWGSDVIWSSDIIDRDSTTAYGTIGTTSPIVNSRGYFISPKIFSDEQTDNYNLFSIKYGLLEDADSIIVKYRTRDDDRDIVDVASTNWNITWTSTTTFTTTDTNWADAVVGDEVEVLRGAGAGLLAHISEISLVSGTYTITLDETFRQYTTGDIGKAIFRNWIKLCTLTSADTNGFYSQEMGASGKFLQLKVELRGVGTKIEQIKVDNKYLLPANR